MEGKVARILLQKHETSHPTTSAPGSNHRKVILRRVPRSIRVHVPSEARSDGEDVSEKLLSSLEVTWSVGKEYITSFLLVYSMGPIIPCLPRKNNNTSLQQIQSHRALLFWKLRYTGSSALSNRITQLLFSSLQYFHLHIRCEPSPEW